MKSLAQVDGVDLWAADIDPNAAGLYLVPADRRLLLPRGDDPGFVGALLDWCRSEAIDVVFPTVDQELLPLAEGRSAFLERGVTLVLAEAQVLATCLDKWRLYQACRGRVPVPRTALLDDAFEVADWALPLIAKTAGRQRLARHPPGAVAGPPRCPAPRWDVPGPGVPAG
jgi:carbamoyl-phosphate synthase large subunit